MSEIFRHLRPLYFDKDRVTVTPQRNGGVTYLVKPIGQAHYEFWIYICPLDAEFSAKVATRKLREVANNGVAPWGNFRLEQWPLMDYLVWHTARTDLPTEAGKMADQIWKHNQLQKELKEIAVAKRKVLSHYQEDQ